MTPAEFSGIGPVVRSDLPLLEVLARDANTSPYDLSQVLEEKLFEHGVGGAPEPRAAYRNGRVVGVSVTCGNTLRLLLVARESQRQGVGTELLEDAEERLASRGVWRIGVAAEAGNYFTPGVFENDAVTLRFFERRGYARQEEIPVNLVASLAGATTVNTPSADEVIVRRVRPDEKQIAGTYIEREFGPIWRFEALRAFDIPTLPLFVAEKHGEIVGFVAHEVNNRGLAFFGPTGVSTSVRGQGIGRLLLYASLDDLRRMGHDRTFIAWASSHDFYERSCGAKLAHRFVRLTKTLGQPQL